jgi:hypothetical protein
MATNDSQEKLGLELASAVSRLEKVYKVNVHMEHTIYICCTYCLYGTFCTHYTCSVSRWRPQKVDKRMVLEYTHGLFIT